MMRALRLSEMAATVSGQLHGRDARFESVCIDSRSLRAQQLFFAIRGEHFDGHDFLPEVERRGAAGAVVAGAPVPQIGRASCRERV